MEYQTIPLLAVDGGGTKCLAVFMDTKERWLGQGRAGSCNYQGIGREAALQELTQGIRAALVNYEKQQSCSLKNKKIEVECAVFGLAGLDTEYDRHIIAGMVGEVLQSLKIEVKHLLVENDGLAALLGATAGEPGILVIAGTGSIVYGINQEGISARAGGWGHKVGDEGSGYWIGKQAIMAVLKAEDGRGEPTELGSWILPHLGLKTPEDLFNWIYSADYSVEKVGELSRFVSYAVSGGDQVAHQILKVAGHELFLGAHAVVNKLDLLDKPFKIILQGGVLQNDNLVRQLLMEKIRKYTTLAKIDVAKHDPIYGVLAKGLSYLKAKHKTNF